MRSRLSDDGRLERENKELSEALAQLQADMRKLQAQLEATRRELAASMGRESAMAAAHAAEVSALELRISTLEAQLAKANAALKDLRAELAKLRVDLKNALKKGTPEKGGGGRQSLTKKINFEDKHVQCTLLDGGGGGDGKEKKKSMADVVAVAAKIAKMKRMVSATEKKTVSVEPSKNSFEADPIDNKQHKWTSRESNSGGNSSGSGNGGMPASFLSEKPEKPGGALAAVQQLALQQSPPPPPPPPQAGSSITHGASSNPKATPAHSSSTTRLASLGGGFGTALGNAAPGQAQAAAGKVDIKSLSNNPSEVDRNTSGLPQSFDRDKDAAVAYSAVSWQPAPAEGPPTPALGALLAASASTSTLPPSSLLSASPGSAASTMKQHRSHSSLQRRPQSAASPLSGSSKLRSSPRHAATNMLVSVRVDLDMVTHHLRPGGPISPAATAEATQAHMAMISPNTHHSLGKHKSLAEVHMLQWSSSPAQAGSPASGKKGAKPAAAGGGSPARIPKQKRPSTAKPLPTKGIKQQLKERPAV